ncbi:MAG: hypothetical protein HRU38_17245 [Saccharospirillaceae bacterium]|nr:hypothetical protein [Pseudomonadales bacterium]NRB80384.1 hypothetical protein [Saccharospirillaceae bacterium]
MSDNTPVKAVSDNKSTDTKTIYTKKIDGKMDTEQMNKHISAGIKHYRKFALNWLMIRGIPHDSSRMYIIEEGRFRIITSQADIEAMQQKGTDFKIGHLVVVIRELFAKEQGIVSAMQMLELLDGSEQSVQKDDYLDAFISYSSALEKMEYLIKADFSL